MPKLQYRFNNATKDISLYETKPNDKNIAVQIDGKTYYAGLLPVGHSRASNLRIYRDGETYAVSKEGGDKVALEDYSWAEIASIIKAGNAAEYFAVGDTRPITLGSVQFNRWVTDPTGGDRAGTYRVQILGIDHNAEIEGYKRVHFAIGRDADDTTDIAFFGQYMNSTATNAGGWEDCEMRTWLNETFYNALPADLRAVITPCTKYTDNVGGSTNVEENVTATSDKIWLPAAFEVFGYCGDDSDGANSYEQYKQAQYDYYKKGAGTARYVTNTLRDKAMWWLRSPDKLYKSPTHAWNDILFCTVDADSTLKYKEAKQDSGQSVVPCFTIS